MDPEQDPDPLYHETDRRIWIRIKMKRIHNTDWKFKRGQVYYDQKTKFIDCIVSKNLQTVSKK